jgi:hypothetical protein
LEVVPSQNTPTSVNPSLILLREKKTLLQRDGSCS